MALIKPPSENAIEVSSTIAIVIPRLCMLNFVKNNATNVTTMPTQIPLATPPATNPIKIMIFGIGATNISSICF